MDFFPSESKSLGASVSAPNAVDPAAEVWLQPPNTTEVTNLNSDVTDLNLTVTQVMKEVQGLWAELGQLRTMVGELVENYGTLLQKYSAADQHRRDIETAFARIDSLAQTRLADLNNASAVATRTEKMLARVESVSAETDRLLAAVTDARNLFGSDLAQARNASDLATRTEKMLTRVESVSAETDRQLAAITDAGNLLSRDLAQAKNASDLATRTEKMLTRSESVSAETDRQLAAISDARNRLNRELAQARAKAQSRADAPDAPPSSIDRLNSLRALLGAAIAAIHKTTARTSRRAAVIATLALFAVVAIAATWPDGNANEVGLPTIESRVVRTFGLQLPELPETITPAVPERLTPIAPVVSRPSMQARSSSPRVASSAPAPAAGFMGQLAVQSSPPGAAIFIDGKPVGETPMSSLQIRAGSHAVWIELPKHRRWTASVQVPAGRLTRVSATLQSVPNVR